MNQSSTRSKIRMSFFYVLAPLRLQQWKIYCAFVFVQFICIIAFTQNEVPQAVMEQIYHEVKTPYKYGLVVVPGDESKKIDCPSVYRQGKSWYMTYIQFDGRGYETWLATSNNLLQWKTMGRILSFSDTADWDINQKAGYIALQDPVWGGS